jgi:hypothetical protein
MKCFTCGSELRLTVINGKTYCFRCEADASMEQYGIIRPIKGRTA